MSAAEAPADTTESTHRPEMPGRERWYTARSGPLTYLPAALGALLAVVTSTAFRQLTHPFLSHDDWDTILPATPWRSDLLYVRQLAEGRWLNYVWWRTGGPLLTPVTATLLYFGAYSAFVVRLARSITGGWWGLLIAAALFVSPMVAEAAYWPAILGPSMVVLAASTWLLPLCRHRVPRLLIWMSLSTLMAMLTYQPVALLIFLVLMLEERHRPLRQLAALAVGFCVVWVGAIVVTFTLNWFSFGTFGVRPQAWRKPNELASFADLVQNLGAVGTHFQMVIEATPVAVILGLASILVRLLLPALRTSGVLLLLSVLVMSALESLSTIQAGFLTPYRSSMWVWVVVVVAVFGLTELTPRAGRILAAVGLIVVLASGSTYWIHSVSEHQQRLDTYDEMAWRTKQLLEKSGSTKAVIVGSKRDWSYYVFLQQATYLRSRTAFETGVTPSYCRPATCALARDPDVIDERSDVFVDRDRVIIRPPASEWNN